MRRFTILLAVGALLTSAAHGQTTPPAWSADRLALGVSAQAIVYSPDDGVETTGFLPQAWVSYSLTSAMSVAASGERDFAHNFTLLRGGVRFALTPATSHTQLALGVDALSYERPGPLVLTENHSWSASIRAAWVAVQSDAHRDLVYLTASGERDVTNSLTTYRVGLRVPLMGGQE